MKILNDFPIKINLKINWGEMDIYGHVNSVHYFRYFETSRIAYIREIGFYDCFNSDGLGGVLSKVSCNFMVPIKYPDSLEVGTRTVNINKERIIMEHYISSSKNGLSAFGKSELVIYDFQNEKKILVPAFLKKSIETLEKRKF